MVARGPVRAAEPRAGEPDGAAGDDDEGEQRHGDQRDPPVAAGDADGRSPPARTARDAGRVRAIRRPTAALWWPPDSRRTVVPARGVAGRVQPSPAVRRASGRRLRGADQAADHRAAARHDRADDGRGRARACPSVWLIVATVVGGTLAAGGANAINMYVDRDIDALMERTQNRPAGHRA